MVTCVDSALGVGCALLTNRKIAGPTQNDVAEGRWVSKEIIWPVTICRFYMPGKFLQCGIYPSPRIFCSCFADKEFLQN